MIDEPLSIQRKAIVDALEKADSKVLDEMEQLLKDRGLLKNLAINAIQVIGAGLNIKDEEAEIRSKYRTIQFWISIGVTCILFAWSYFYVMIPSAEIEINIEEKIHKQTEAHFNDVNIWVINKLNEITKSL